MPEPTKTDALDALEEIIRRAYNYPDLSPWHVREALREIVKVLRDHEERLK